MSLKDQQFTSGKLGIAAYSPFDTLLANGAARLLMLSFNLASNQFAGLSIGIGVSDLLAWTSGLSFEIVVNGQVKILIADELCTLLQKEFFPMDLPANAKIELFATSIHPANIQVAAFIRAESV